MRRTIRAGLTAALVFISPLTIRVGAEAPLYSLQDLGTLDGVVPSVTGLNASGQLSGFVNGGAGPRAARFRDGAWSYVPGLENVPSVAFAINDHGDLTGYHFTPQGMRAFRYVEGTGIEVIEPLPGGTMTIGWAINNNGEVVGQGNTPQGSRGWRAAPGLPAVALPTLGGMFGTACGVNDAGQIAGTASLPDETQHAVRVDVDGSIADLGAFDGPSGTSASCGIDATGRVVGRATRGGAFHAFRYAGGLVDLNAFGATFSTAEATVNGRTVGFFSSPVDGNPRAFVHTAADGSVDLNTRIPADSGWLLAQPKAVNADGQIAGQGLLGGVTRAFLLTPVVPPDTTAPVITSLSADPSSIVPPNNAMVAVSVAVTATDDRDEAPACSLTGIDGHGAPASDFSVTGPFSGSVRTAGGATYSFVVTCADAAGNQSAASVDVVVPRDTTAPVISRISASPYAIWPPNGKMIPVSVSVTASDNVDPMPACSISSIASSDYAPADAVITGNFNAEVRATRNADGSDRVYTIHVTCTDTAGNQSGKSVDVTISKDANGPTKMKSHASHRRDRYTLARRPMKELLLALAE